MAISLDTGFCSESNSIGNPMMAASTSATAPMSRLRARFFSGSAVSEDDLSAPSSCFLLRVLRSLEARESSSEPELYSGLPLVDSCFLLPRNENKPIR